MAETEGPWVVAHTVCRVCGHKAVSVHPVQADDDALECARCHQMTCEVTDE